MAKSNKAPAVACASKAKVIRAIAVVKSGHLLSECFELTIEDGVVVGVKALSRAPDLNSSSVGHGASALWRHIREQVVADLPKPVEEP